MYLGHVVLCKCPFSGVKCVREKGILRPQDTVETETEGNKEKRKMKMKKKMPRVSLASLGARKRDTLLLARKNFLADQLKDNFSLLLSTT